MPEFSEYLIAEHALRLAVSVKSSRELAQGYRSYRNGEYDQAKAQELLKKLFDLIFEIKGAIEASEFLQEATR